MLFNIWHPTRIAVDQVSFDVTRANAPSVSASDPDWIAACLDAIGISSPAREWSVQATRCYFYSDYPDESEWSDRWPKTWTVGVTLDGEAPSEFARPDGTAYQVDQYDETWEHGEVDPDHDRTALLLLFVQGQRADATPVRDDLSSSLPADSEVESTRVDRAGEDLQQVRILVRGELFPEQAGTLEAVLQRARDQGHFVNRYDLFDA